MKNTSLKTLIAGTPLEPVARRLWRSVRRLPAPDHRNAIYDRQTFAVMQRVIERASNCVDVGAFKGYFLRSIVDLAPDGDHFAFEPLPHLAEALRQRFPRAHVVQAALADTAGSKEFRHVQGAEAYSGFFRRPYDTYEEDVEMITVEVRRLDDVIPKTISPRFIKVDVEGGEAPVFAGGLDTIASAQPYVAFETGWDPERTFDVLAGQAGLRISLLSAWLDGRPSLGREQFLDETLSGRHFFFLAHPTE